MSYLLTMTHDRSIKLFLTHHPFQTSPGNKEICMFYISRIIIFSVFWELLRNPILIWVQKALTMVVRIFERVGLQKNLGKTKVMVCTPGLI